ncbi:hypothetical protein BJ878DRAFT_479768 [Calycina marina]|uniref:SH3 domain-containing protein n=1 Tax=Calycina marina TaxID=1763456 RepID=A0A9P7Z3S9_9HELO|nr:hypothetical protein BJ878DRAFT_479768 [Calycina marina]
MDDFIAPVRGIIKALYTATKLAKRVSKATTSAPEEQTLQIAETARSLQSVSEECSRDIGDAYKHVLGSCGLSFSAALLHDEISAEQLKELRIKIIDGINDCPDYDEDEEYIFDKAPFTKLEQSLHECAIVCLRIFKRIRDRILQEKRPTSRLEEDVDSNRLNTKRISFTRKPVPQAIENRTSLLSSTPKELSRSAEVSKKPEPPKPPNPWSLEDSPTLDTQFGYGSPTKFSISSTVRGSPRDVSPSTKPDGPISREIRHQREVVKFRLNANEEFLEKRRRSKINFQNELKNIMLSSDGGPVAKPGTSWNSPLCGGPVSPMSPNLCQETRISGSGYEVLMTRQRSQGQASRGSRTSSMIQSQPGVGILQRNDSQASQDSIFGLGAVEPLSPPRSTHRRSDNLATTLQLPDFGKGVEPGIEAVNGIDHDDGKMLVHEGNTVTPAASVKSIDHQMRHDSSFYKFGGFCEGAKMFMKGATTYKQVKRPAGNFSSMISAKCPKCAYETNWQAIENDAKMDVTGTGIQGSGGIRYRQRFLSKCHVKTSSHEEPYYACIFCIEEKRTLEPHDATLFFSAALLIRHLAKHPQPMSPIAGLHVLYGVQPAHTVDFDVHFAVPHTKTTQYNMSEISSKVYSRPIAHATMSNHFKITHPKSRDAAGEPILHFAAGARIVGVTFPEKFGGQWCRGYHDGDRGIFPASSITLDLPGPEDVLMNAQNSLVAFAKWDFKPKDTKEGGWLSFKKGEKITCIGYAFQDQWCWSGQTSKGKWGLFPQAFVESLCMDNGSSSGSVSKGLGARIASIPLGKKKSARPERSISIVSNSSSGIRSIESINGQPGLEVVSGRVVRGAGVDEFASR